jgi:hypothetical protein
MSRSSMTSHIHNAHGIPIKDYKESNYPDIEVETNWFQCRLCPAKTKFVKDCIAPHLKMSHNLDIETYEQEFMKPEDWPNSVVPTSTLRSENKLSAAMGTSKQSKHQDLDEEEEDDGMGDDKWNKCRYRCSLCNFTCVDSRQMRTHIAATHRMSYEQYALKYGSSEVVTKRFECEM